jgi:hypothetical protein
MSSQPRIVISRRTTYERLLEQVAEHSGEVTLIVGMGARARRLLDRLHSEVPNVDRPWRTSGGHEQVAFLDDGSMNIVTWGHDDPGKPPVAQVEEPPTAWFGSTAVRDGALD